MLVAASEFNHPETFRKQINNVFNINKYFVFIGQRKERNVLFNDTVNTFYLRL